MKKSRLLTIVAALLMLGAGVALAAETGKATKESKAALANPLGRKVYEAVCAVCHTRGMGNAPKLEDKAAWKARIAAGMLTLETSAIHGKGGMPPRAGRPQLTDEEIKAAVAYMVEMSR